MKRSLVVVAFVLALAGLLVGGFFVWSKQQQNALRENLDRYERRLARFPDDPETYRKLSELYEKVGDFQKAEEYYALSKKFEKTKEQLENKRQMLALERRLAERDSGAFGVGGKPSPKPKTPTKSPKKPSLSPERKQAIRAYEEAERYYQRKDVYNAERRLEEAIRFDATFGKPHVLGAKIKLNSKAFAEAEKRAKQGTQLDPTLSEGFVVLGDVFVAYKAHDQAEDAYQKAIEADRRSASAYYKLGNLKYRQKRFEDAVGLYKSCLSIEANFYKARVNMGMAHHQLNELKQARRALLGALNIPEIRTDKKVLHRVYGTLGFLNKSLGRYAEAEAQLKKATSLGKKAIDHVLLGIVYEEQGKKESAKKAYRSALALEANNTEALYNMGTLLMNERKFDEALGYYDRVLSSEPSHERALVNTAVTYVLMDERDSAKRYLDRAIGLNPENAKANIEMAKYWKEKNIIDKAASYARAAIEHSESDSDTAKYYNELGYVYMQANLTNEALEAFLGAKGIEPSNQETLKSLVNVYVQKEAWKDAIETAEVLLRLNEGAFDYYEVLAKLYLKANQKEKAKKLLNALLRQKPDYENAEAVKALLGTL